MTSSQNDCYAWTYYIFFVNNDGIITSLWNCPASEANDTRLHTTNTVATQQLRPKPRGLCSVGDYAGESLQEDQGCW